MDAKVITGYLEKALGEASFKAEGEEVSNKGEIQAEGRINIKLFIVDGGKWIAVWREHGAQGHFGGEISEQFLEGHDEKVKI